MPYPYVGIKYRDSREALPPQWTTYGTDSTYGIPKAYNCDYKWRKHQCYSKRVVRGWYWWWRWRRRPPQCQRWRYQHARIVHMGRILIKGSSNGIFAPIISNIRSGRQKRMYMFEVGACVFVWRAQRRISIVVVDAWRRTMGREKSRGQIFSAMTRKIEIKWNPWNSIRNETMSMANYSDAWIYAKRMRSTGAPSIYLNWLRFWIFKNVGRLCAEAAGSVLCFIFLSTMAAAVAAAARSAGAGRYCYYCEGFWVKFAFRFFFMYNLFASHNGWRAGKASIRLKMPNWQWRKFMCSGSARVAPKWFFHSLSLLNNVHSFIERAHIHTRSEQQQRGARQ